MRTYNPYRGKNANEMVQLAFRFGEELTHYVNGQPPSPSRVAYLMGEFATLRQAAKILGAQHRMRVVRYVDYAFETGQVIALMENEQDRIAQVMGNFRLGASADSIDAPVISFREGHTGAQVTGQPVTAVPYHRTPLYRRHERLPIDEGDGQLPLPTAERPFANYSVNRLRAMAYLMGVTRGLTALDFTSDEQITWLINAEKQRRQLFEAGRALTEQGIPAYERVKAAYALGELHGKEATAQERARAFKVTMDRFDKLEALTLERLTKLGLPIPDQDSDAWIDALVETENEILPGGRPPASVVNFAAASKKLKFGPNDQDLKAAAQQIFSLPAFKQIYPAALAAEIGGYPGQAGWPVAPSVTVQPSIILPGEAPASGLPSMPPSPYGTVTVRPMTPANSGARPGELPPPPQRPRVR